MARRDNLQVQYAQNVVGKISSHLADKKRGAARTLLGNKLTTIPSLQSSPANIQTAEQVTNWRAVLVNALGPLLGKYPVFAADVIELLAEFEEYQLGESFIASQLPDVDKSARRRYVTLAAKIEYVAAFNGVEPEILLAASALLMQQERGQSASEDTLSHDTAQRHARLVTQLALTLPTKAPTTQLAVINAALNLPYTMLSPAMNKEALQLALVQSEQLLARSQQRRFAEPCLEQVWKTHIRAGTHLASHLMAYGELDAGRDLFERFDESACAAIKKFPKSHLMHGARLRLLHKWYKYEEDTESEFTGIRLVRSIYNAAVSNAKKEGLGDHLSINIRRARFERDAGSRKLGYRFIARAAKQAPKSKYVQDIIALWVAKDKNQDEYLRQLAVLERAASRPAARPKRLRPVRHPNG